MCSICLGRLFSVNNDVSITQCGHMFHKSCLEGSMQTNTKCPICKTEITNTVAKIHPDVNDELVYDGASNDIKNFLEQMYEYERQKSMIRLKIMKRLDKENTHLKRRNRTLQENDKTCRLYLNGFQRYNNEWQEVSQMLQLETYILAEINKYDGITCKQVTNHKEVKKTTYDDTFSFCNKTKFNIGLSFCK